MTNFNNNSGSAGIPHGYDLNNVLRTGMSRSIPCFGGKLFYAQGHDGNCIICHYIESNDEALVQHLSHWYRWTSELRQVPFLSYRTSVRLSDSEVVFMFSHPGGKLTSMRELMNSTNHQNYAQSIKPFQKMVSFLDLYDRISNQAIYVPLVCFSLDTVFIDSATNLHVLPLMGAGSYPTGYPMEASTNQVSVRTDLYTAALVAVQVASGFELESVAENRCMRMDLLSDIEKKCLSAFPSCRPDLNTIVNRRKGFKAGKTFTGMAPTSPVRFWRKTCNTVNKVIHFLSPMSDVACTAGIPKSRQKCSSQQTAPQYQGGQFPWEQQNAWQPQGSQPTWEQQNPWQPQGSQPAWEQQNTWQPQHQPVPDQQDTDSQSEERMSWYV